MLPTDSLPRSARVHTRRSQGTPTFSALPADERTPASAFCVSRIPELIPLASSLSPMKIQGYPATEGHRNDTRTVHPPTPLPADGVLDFDQVPQAKS